MSSRSYDYDHAVRMTEAREQGWAVQLPDLTYVDVRIDPDEHPDGPVIMQHSYREGQIITEQRATFGELGPCLIRDFVEECEKGLFS